MPPWLQHMFEPPPVRLVGYVLGGAVASLALLLLLIEAITRRVIRRVFGTLPLPTIQTTTQEIATARAETAAIIEAEMRTARAEMLGNVRQMVEATIDRGVPLTIAVSTPEERQTLEALLARSPRVVYRQIHTKNKTPADRERERAPTAWDRVLTDEEGTSCPTTSQQPSPQQPSRRARPRVQKRKG